MTSAPISPSSMQQNGPAITWLRSRTRKPASGSGDEPLRCADFPGRRALLRSAAAGFFGTLVLTPDIAFIMQFFDTVGKCSSRELLRLLGRQNVACPRVAA